jgi:lipopolysaccharide/colanic/teichoic acid biosynthesis glycosyltransferase
MKDLIIKETSPRVYEFIRPYLDGEPSGNLLISTTTRFNILKQEEDTYNVIINLHRVNDIRYLNKFFEAVNSKLVSGGFYIGCVETYMLRKKRILRKYPPGINWLFYTLDFILKRLMPKLSFTKQLYFFITRGMNRTLSKSETYGRLYCCGFELEKEVLIDNLLFFVTRKTKDPVFDYNPTYGPIIRLKRVGKNGEMINVYKLRTMHAYSEYLQDYIFTTNKLAEGGKFKNDFRITTLGAIFRKFWLDELPMLINVFIKGNMKFVGVRPLSKQYYNLYREDLKKRRIKYKPGLIPPFYVDMPKTLDEIMESETRYLNRYEKHPFLTDWVYFWKAMYNIFIRRARSK